MEINTQNITSCRETYKLRQMRLLFALITILILCNCNTGDGGRVGNNVAYFNSFDLFNLKAGDTIRNRRNNFFVKVTFNVSRFPTLIEYHSPAENIKLTFEDSFRLETGRPIYVFTTSNLYGGPSGRHRVYSFHTEEYKDIVYCSLSDTMLCQTENVPKDRNFTFNLFIRTKDDGIYRVTQGEHDYDRTNSKLSKPALYTRWKNLLIYNYGRDSLVSGPETDLPFARTIKL